MTDVPDSSPGSPSVRASGVTYSYAGTPVLVGLDLTIDGGITGLLGVNGAGKTTLLRLLATLAAPAAGQIEVLGESTKEPAARRRIRTQLGYLPQKAAWTPSMRAGDFLWYFAYQRGVPASRRKAAIERAAARTDCERLLKARLGQLSGGEHQRVMLAQAIVHEPALLVLDEPTVGLDPEQRHNFREVIAELAADSCVLLSTHLLEDIRHLADRVAILHEGRIAFEDTPAELASRAWSSGDDGDALQQGFLRTIQEKATPA